MDNRGQWGHPLVKACLLFGFALYIVYLVKTDRLSYYIAPRMELYVKLSALGLYAVGAYQLYAALSAYWGKRPSCDCGHPPSRSLWKNSLVYGLFAFPLLLGFLLPDTIMGSALAAKKGMNLNSAASVKTSTPKPAPDHAASPPVSADAGRTSPPAQQPEPERKAPKPEPGGAAAPKAGSAAPAPASPNANAASDGNTAAKAAALTDAQLEKLFPYDKFTEHFAKHARQLYKLPVIQVKDDLFIETLTTLDLYADQFKGKKMELTGFVYRDETMNDKQFVVGRFAVQCCSADAAPFGVLVQYDRAKQIAADEWIQVTGTIGKTNFNGSELMVIEAQKIEKIEPPKEQYVYPNYDFGS